MPRRLLREEYTVGWVCALDIELVAAQEMLDEEYDAPLSVAHETNIYTCGRIGEHHVVIACLPEGRVGTTSAATVADQIRMTFPSIRFGLMVGIGGGVPSELADVRLGDVVVSKPHRAHGGVVQYDFGKATLSGFERTGFLDGPPTVLLNAVVNLKAKLMRRRGKMFQCLFTDLPDFTREAAGADILFQADYTHVGGTTCNGCDMERAVIRGVRTQDLVVHYGTIASGNKVIKNAVIRDQVSAELGGVLCFEMEAAGLMNNFPCLIIRGISDYADSHKNDRWQPYAAATAAAYTKELLCVVPASEVNGSRIVEDAITEPVNHPRLGLVPRTGTNMVESPSGKELVLVNQQLLTAAAKECLRSLAFPEQEQRFLNVHTAQNTCQWLLDDKQYQTWAKSSRGIFWIKGHPGTGKSVLTKFAATSYRKLNPHQVVATFFIHGQGKELQHTTYGLFRALLNSILMGYPQHLLELTSIFESRNERYGDHKEGRWDWSTSELQETLSRVLREGTVHQPATLFIDALDECGEEAARGLLAFFEAQTKCDTAKVKICVSSRHYPVLGLDNNPTIYAEERNADDIKWYVGERLKGIQSTTQREIFQEGILQKAEGGFQWVLLVTDMMLDGNLNGVRLEKLRNKLASCPGDLSQLYGAMLDGATAADRSQMLKLFEWILFAERPLSAQELREALATDADMTCTSLSQMREHDSWSDTLDAFERHVKRLSRGLVEFQTRELWELYDPGEEDWSHEAHLVHQSVADFLLGTYLDHRSAGNMRAFPSTTARGHFQISRSCMKYLSFEEVLDSAQQPREQVISKFPLALYAMQFTFRHILRVEKEGMNQDDLVSAFQWRHDDEKVMRRKEDLWKTLDPTRIHTPVGWPFTGASILHVLVACGSRSACSTILGASIEEANCLDADGNTPLMLAIREGYQDIALMMLELPLQSSLQHNGSKGQSSVGNFGAIQQGRAPIDVNVMNDDDDTALAIALDEKAETVVERLIEKGAELERLLGREDALVRLAIGRRNQKLLDIVFQRHLNLDGAIWYALEDSSAQDPESLLGLVERLLESGAKVTKPQGDEGIPVPPNQQDDHVLVLASRLGLVAVVDRIISHCTSDSNAHLPWQAALLAATNNNHLETVQILVDCAAAASENNDRDDTSSLTASLGNLDIFFLILVKGNFPDIVSTVETTVVESSRRGCLEVLALLLGFNDLESHDETSTTDSEQPPTNLEKKPGSESKKQDTYPESPESYSRFPLCGDDFSDNCLCKALLAAAENGHEDAVYMLLQNDRVNIDTYFLDGGDEQTPLFIAAEAGHVGVVETLLNYGAEPSAVDKKGWTPLTIAAHKGHCKVVELLIDNGVAVDEQGGNYDTALGAAAWAGENEMIELLLTRGADINKPVQKIGCVLGAALWENKDGTADLLLGKGADIHTEGGHFNNPLGVAAYKGNKQMVERLLTEGANMHAKGEFFANALGAAASGGYKDVVDLLLERGASIHQQGGRYGHALGAAANDGQYNLVELFLEMGADVSIAGDTGRTALHLAAFEDQIQVARLLVERNADLNAQSDTGETPLMEASKQGHSAVVELLLERGADVAAVDKDGWTSLSFAASNGHEDVATMLLEKKAEMCSACDGSTPLSLAVGQGHSAVVELLLERGANPNSSTNGSTPTPVPADDGVSHASRDIKWTPLSIAASDGHGAIVEMLLAKGADLSFATHGWTALHFAAQDVQGSAVTSLLVGGADIDSVTDTGYTPLGLAAFYDRSAVAQLLLEKGAVSILCGTNNVYGSPANMLASKGRTDLLRLLVEHNAVHLRQPDPGQRTPLQFAAHGGHMETLRYIVSQCREPSASDLDQDCDSQGIMQSDLDQAFKPYNPDEPWGVLHWACRAGSQKILEMLLPRQLPVDRVSVPGMQGAWSPAAIGVFHGHSEVLQGLSETDQTYLGFDPNDTNSEGEKQGGALCNACLLN
ncbi:hypothetical protein SVAN01_06439 [Stagonosporopsis vannaccii]|nr:hypothetical protein SVAN01_06439 [Stagonosporopsis vannaccii]